MAVYNHLASFAWFFYFCRDKRDNDSEKKKNYRIRSEYSMKYRVLKRILHSVFSFILLYQGMYVFYETRFHFENSSAPARKK